MKCTNMFDDEDFDLSEDLLNKLEDDVISTNVGKVKYTVSPAGTTNDFMQQPNSKVADNISVLVDVSPKRVVLKRKFPGPAGLFPESNKPFSNNHLNETLLLNSQFLSTQSSDITFGELTWQCMCHDFQGSNLRKKYNIQWIKDNLESSLINKQVPFLSGIIKQIKNTLKSPIFVLVDDTGEIESLISTELYEDYNEHLLIGSVVVLKQFSLLSISEFKHYINIINGNLIRIYSCKDISSDVKIVHLQQQMSIKQLEDDTNAFVSQYEQEQYNQVLRRSKDNVKSVDEIPSKQFYGYKGNHNYTNQKDMNANLKLNNGFRDRESKPRNVDNTCYVKKTPLKRFNFKNTLNNKVNLCNLEYTWEPQETTNTPNIFDCSHDTTDLDLNLDDFKDEIGLNGDQNASDNNVDQSETNCSDLRYKEKRKRDATECKPEIETGLSKTVLKIEGAKIDCSQISIISQTIENPDIIKEVFSDLDASALFDEF